MALQDKKHRVNKNKSLFDSFYHAYEGIKYAVVSERNMQIHLSFAILVTIFGLLLSISYAEWLVCLVLIALVFSLELVNTAIESTVDLITTDENSGAKVAKDAASGAVLVAAIISAFIGFIIFIPKIFDLFLNL